MNIDNISISDIKECIATIKNDNIISIRTGVNTMVLSAINHYLKENNNIKVIVTCDEAKEDINNETVRNMEVLKFLINTKHLVIFSHSSTPLESIKNITYIEELHSFLLDGLYKPNIDFTPLKSHTKIKHLEINSVLKIKDYDLLSLPLEKLSLPDIDLEKTRKNKMLKELCITRKIKNETLLAATFPNLKKIKLQRCSNLKDYSFLSGLKLLQHLSFNSTQSLVSLPEINSKNINRLEFINCKKLNNISNIFEYKKLESLWITFSKIEYDTIEKIANTIPLKYFYFVSTKSSEDNKFKSLPKTFSTEYK